MANVTFTLTGTAGDAKTKDATPRTLKTASDGTLTITDLYTGTYTLTETVPSGYVNANSPYTLEVKASGVTIKTKSGTVLGTDLTVVNKDGWTVENTPTRKLSLIKKDSAGNVMKDVTFTLKKGTATVAADSSATKTNASGAMSWSNLGPGDYTLTEITPTGYLPKNPSWTFRVDTKLSLTSGSSAGVFAENNGNGTLTVTNTPASVTVTKYNSAYSVDDAAGRLENVTFTLTGKSGNAASYGTKSLKTGADGKVTFSPLPDGTYTLDEMEGYTYKDFVVRHSMVKVAN